LQNGFKLIPLIPCTWQGIFLFITTCFSTALIFGDFASGHAGLHPAARPSGTGTFCYNGEIIPDAVKKTDSKNWKYFL
jgi:hypothetical protein